MRASIVNIDTSKKYQLKLDIIDPLEIRSIGKTLALSCFNYKIVIFAEKEQDIDFINNNFYNLPVPASPSKNAFWVGDDALFIIINYPLKKS